MSDNVTSIRDAKGRIKKGHSGNPHGVSAKEQALKEMKLHNEQLLSTLITANVPAAVKLHKMLLKGGKEMSTKDAIHLVELTYKYGIGTPRQAPDPQQSNDYDEVNVEDMPEEKRQAIIALLNQTAKDSTTE
jgi:hypothetical protein